MKIKSIIDTKLEGYLKSDIKLLGLPTDFTLDLKGYSKKYYPACAKTCTADAVYFGPREEMVPLLKKGWKN